MDYVIQLQVIYAFIWGLYSGAGKNFEFQACLSLLFICKTTFLHPFPLSQGAGKFLAWLEKLLVLTNSQDSFFTVGLENTLNFRLV